MCNPCNHLKSVVPREGVEPSRGLAPADFKSAASTIPPPRHQASKFGLEAHTALKVYCFGPLKLKHDRSCETMGVHRKTNNEQP